MFLKSLNLINFRNYSNLSLVFTERPTIFVGNNGVGKSNILESVYFLSTTKSPRVDLDGELIKAEESFARAEGVLTEGVDETSLEVVIQIEGAKRVKVNGVPRRVVDFVGTFPAVLFLPSDIEMVTSSPSLRRWHLDLGLAQVDRLYKKALTSYGDLLTARNRVLKRIKEGLAKADELIYWTDELLKNAALLTFKRREFFNFIEGLDTPFGELSFNYKESILSKERLEEYRYKEVAASTTLIGPHRDDFNFLLKGKSLAHFGSRGEQRTATLFLKLSQLEYMSSRLKKRPVLLLDDVFSELDGNHRKLVTEVAKLQQTIISTVELNEIPAEFLTQSEVFRVDGKITPVDN